ncbi:MAG: hypothetical protein OEM52_07155 [bacterium]|nr:hypothetical protein [bacterium]
MFTISSAYLQLVLLSVLQAGTRITGERIEQRSSEEFALIKAEIAELKEMHTELHTLVKGLGKGKETTTHHFQLFYDCFDTPIECFH